VEELSVALAILRPRLVALADAGVP
jgi:hypothetical protein